MHMRAETEQGVIGEDAEHEHVHASRDDARAARSDRHRRSPARRHRYDSSDVPLETG